MQIHRYVSYMTILTNQNEGRLNYKAKRIICMVFGRFISTNLIYKLVTNHKYNFATRSYDATRADIRARTFNPCLLKLLWLLIACAIIMPYLLCVCIQTLLLRR